MPKSAVPQYRRQRESSRGDRAFVVLNGRRVQLGAYGSEESRERYARLIAEWEGAGRRPVLTPGEGITIVELAAAFRRHAEAYYRRPDGTQSDELHNFRPILALLRDLYGDTPAASFGPRAMKAIRAKLIQGEYVSGRESGQEKGRVPMGTQTGTQAGKGNPAARRGLEEEEPKRLPPCRNYVNQTMGRLKRIFKWAVAEELISPTVYAALAAVPGLRRGRGEARETPPVRPVSEKDVEAALPFLSEELRAVARLQFITGARSGEILSMRPRDLDASGAVWIYRPESHKTAHHGHERTIYLGPQAQAILRPLLAEVGPGEYVFSPKRAEARRLERRHAERKTPPTYGNVRGSNRERNPKRTPGERYDARAYAHAVWRACRKAGIEPWHPHQLRHTAATRFRAQFSLDVARALLGHRTLRVTDTYAELDASKAAEVAAKIG